MSRLLRLVFILVPVVLLALPAAAQSKSPKRLKRKKLQPAPAILQGDELCTKTAPNGKAWITIYARGENAFIGRLELVAGAKVPEHKDATEEYIHIVHGRGKITIDGKATEVGPGTTIFMPAGAKVSYENGPEKLTAIQVFAGPGPSAKYVDWKGCS
jgi:quercetin dioxygenase-like cupin family protein